jgi:Zn-finger nucleic acid-binding protein
MLCPRCDTGLHMTERQGIEMDYCPECRGVWFDRGELDKLIERSLAMPSFAPTEGQRYTMGREEGFAARRWDDDDDRPRRRKSFWSELFDFD